MEIFLIGDQSCDFIHLVDGSYHSIRHLKHLIEPQTKSRADVTLPKVKNGDSWYNNEHGHRLHRGSYCVSFWDLQEGKRATQSL